MAEKIFHQESKEFQLKIDLAGLPENGGPDGGQGDQAIFALATAAIRQAVASLGARQSEVVVDDRPWRREGIRYDTADGRLKANRLTLAIEATDKRTKLKCKQHDFVPELLFGKPGKSPAYPDRRAAADYKKHDATFKLEQDLHVDNLKYCASGSLYVKGRQTAAKDSSFFLRYFPRLAAILPEAVALPAVSHWAETIFDDIRTSWDGFEIDRWMLVNRRDARTKALLEAELSFKLVQKLDDGWRRRALREANRLYLALQQTGHFQALPPIFTYANPVSSIAIVAAPPEASA